MIHEDLHTLAAEHERSTGAAFTRIVTAALLQYHHSDAKDRDLFMRYAVKLDRGELTVASIASIERNYHTKRARKARTR